ncbi:MAG: energy transducer TonB [Novosphingobium sp.]
MTLHHRITKLASALCAGALLLIGFFPVPAFAKGEPLSLPLEGKWNVRYDEEACQLIGVFGTGDDRILFRLTRYLPGDASIITLYGRKLSSDQIRSNAKLAFGAAHDLRPLETMNGSSGKEPMAILQNVGDLLDRPWPKDKTRLSKLTPEQEASITGMTFEFENRPPFRLEFGSMAVPLKALHACNIDLIKYWGFDPAALASQSRSATPTGSPGTWVTTNDYPKGAYGQNGLVRFLLEVDETGAVSKCHILEKMKPPEFAAVTCQLLTKRAHFRPGLDSAGRPVKSMYFNSVRWKWGD